MTLSRNCFLLIASVVLVGLSLATALTAANPYTFLPGDCPYYAATTVSLVRDGDFEMRNQLEVSGQTLKDHDRFFAVSPTGGIVPKHSTLMPIVAVPAYVLFGIWGFLAFGLLQMLALVYGISRLGGGTSSARVDALVGLLLSPLLAYSYNFSPDVFGTALVVWAFVCANERRWSWCGVLCAAAVWAKVYLAVILLPLAWVVLAEGRSASVRVGVWAVLGLLPMLVLHSNLYGSPLRTGYDCEGQFTPSGELVTSEHYSRFHQPVLEGLGNLLFDRDLGLVTKSAIWLGWPLGLWWAWRHPGRVRRVAGAMAASLVVNVLLFSRYDEWNASVHGNRFLFPSLALSLALQGPFWHHVASSWRDQRPATGP
ncbi:hypothetical protein [Limnoglobus roseus]|uniref:DUF2029 domain-containing protein n=1 Tax=Limnoglobus roseus TaxID=2598579 RepID=A0A5C1AD90_9BACT|nr:hypothetical protein [Limnoglobus roseus]QEL16117.1 hypothetical protein PX52LOC_03056 [Limnoglobus roseus]